MESIISMGRGDEWIVENVTKRNRGVFEYLDVDEPKAVLLNQKIYTQEELDDALSMETKASS